MADCRPTFRHFPVPKTKAGDAVSTSNPDAWLVSYFSKGWTIESDKLPWLTPDRSVEELEDVPDWKRGCIPIGSQGDTYITCLMVTGPDRGRVVYIEYERSWVFFPREPDLLSWYIRWLREAAAGYDMGWFGIFLDGDEETLQKHYVQADTEGKRLLAVDSMEKFPNLSDASQDFICSILRN